MSNLGLRLEPSASVNLEYLLLALKASLESNFMPILRRIGGRVQMYTPETRNEGTRSRAVTTRQAITKLAMMTAMMLTARCRENRRRCRSSCSGKHSRSRSSRGSQGSRRCLRRKS